LVGVEPPHIFEQYLRYQWSNGTVSAEPPPPGTLEITFALEWDAVGGHGRTGPGGFEMSAADGGVAAAAPLQAGYYHAIVHATVTDGRGNNSNGGSDAAAAAAPAPPTTSTTVLAIKRFGFRVEGQPPFRVLNYTRSAAPCQGAGELEEEAEGQRQGPGAVERCGKQTTHVECYSGATVWIAAIQLTAVEHKAGKVKLAIEGAPVGCTVFLSFRRCSAMRSNGCPSLPRQPTGCLQMPACVVCGQAAPSCEYFPPLTACRRTLHAATLQA